MRAKKLINFLFISVILVVSNKGFCLDLLESVLLSKENDSKFLMAKTKTKIIQENEKQAFSLLLPTVSLQVSRSQVEQERKDNLQQFPTQNYTTESDSLTLTQPVYKPKLFSELKKTKKLTLSSKYDEKNEEQSLLLRVSLYYLNALSAVDNTMLQKKGLELLEEQKRFAEKSILAGTGTKTDLLEISVSLDRANAELIKLQQKQDFALAELSIMTGYDVEKIYQFNHDDFIPEELDPGTLLQWQENLNKKNSQILSIAEKLNAAKIAIESSKYDRYPSLDLTAQISKGSSESTFFVNSSTETKSVGLSFRLPIYTGGMLTSKVRQSLEQYNLESEQLRMLTNELKIKVNDSYNGVIEKKSLIKALIKARESAKNLLIANEKSVDSGVRRRLDVLVAQQQLISVEKDLALARFELISAWLTLHFHSGLALEKEIKFINSFLLESDTSN